MTNSPGFNLSQFAFGNSSGFNSTGNTFVVSLGGMQQLTVDINGNVIMDSPGARFQADFSNATVSSRVAFQTNVSDGNTYVIAAPNGTGSTASWIAVNTADPANDPYTAITTTNTDSRLDAGSFGGSYLPLTMYSGGSERMRIDNIKGNVAIAATSAAKRLQIGSGGASEMIRFSTALGVFDIGGTVNGYEFTTPASQDIIFTNPTEHLRIGKTGNITATGNMTVTSNITVGGTATFVGNVIATNFQTYAGINVLGNMDFGAITGSVTGTTDFGLLY
jgi:hypothetical protein